MSAEGVGAAHFFEQSSKLSHQVHRALESMACAGLNVQRLAELCGGDPGAQKLVLGWDDAYGRGDLHRCMVALEALRIRLEAL